MIDTIRVLIVIGVLLFSIILHEVGHVCAALALGDDTPAREGRLSLRPSVHLDSIGTFLVILVAFLAGVGVGWGKPVRTDLGQFKFGRDRGIILVALAGPLVNVLLAIVFGLLLRTPLGPQVLAYKYLSFFFEEMIVLNLVLAVFNLIPLYPMDSFTILVSLLPRKQSRNVRDSQQYGPVILLALVLVPILFALPVQLSLLFYLNTAANFLLSLILSLGR